MFFNVLFVFLYYFVIQVFVLFLFVLCIVSPFVLSLSYFYTRLLTTATACKPNCNKCHHHHQNSNSI